MMLRALAYVLTVVLLLAGVGVVGLLAGPLAAFLAAIAVACFSLRSWLDYRPATGRTASRSPARRRATP